MASRVVMPKLTDTMEEGVLRKWHKKEGDVIESGDPIAEVETDKAVMDLEAFASGVLRKILAPEGSVVPSGNMIAIIAREDEEIDLLIKETKTTLTRSPSPDSLVTPSPDFPSVEDKIRISPLARKMAEAQGINTAVLKGTGPGGRITQKDVEAAIAAPPPSGLSMLRKTLARRMVASKGPVPHFYVTSEMAMENLLAFKKERKSAGLKLTITELFLKAVALTLRQFPPYRSSYQGGAVCVAEQIDLGFAVGVPEGVIAPVIRDCDHKTLSEIADEVREKSRLAVTMRLDPPEYTGAIFSLSNLGMYPVESFSAIITPPESGALAMGRIMEKPVARNGTLVIGQTMKVTLSTDHRVADGVLAAQFLSALNEIVQNPKQLD